MISNIELRYVIIPLAIFTYIFFWVLDIKLVRKSKRKRFVNDGFINLMFDNVFTAIWFLIHFIPFLMIIGCYLGAFMICAYDIIVKYW